MAKITEVLKLSPVRLARYYIYYKMQNVTPLQSENIVMPFGFSYGDLLLERVLGF